MAESLNRNTFDELAGSNMWEIAGLVEVLEKKSVLTRQEIYDAIHERRRRHPETTTLERLPHHATCSQP